MACSEFAYLKAIGEHQFCFTYITHWPILYTVRYDLLYIVREDHIKHILIRSVPNQNVKLYGSVTPPTFAEPIGNFSALR